MPPSRSASPRWWCSPWPRPTRRRGIWSTRCCGRASPISCSSGWCGCAIWRRKGGCRSTRFPPAGSSTRSAPLPCRSRCSSGIEPRTAWLLGILWVLKVVPGIPGLRQLRRVLVLESGPLLSVLVIFLMVVFSGVGRGIFPGARRAAADLRQRAGGAVVGGGDADHDRLWRRGADHAARPHGRGDGHDLRPRRVRALDRYSGDRLCRRDPPRQFPEDVGDRQQGAVLRNPAACRDRRRHPHAANRWTCRRAP